MDLMIDLETLSTSNNAAILTMAAIKFDPHADYRKVTVDQLPPNQVFYKRIDLDSCLKIGLVTNDETINWWGTQPKEAQEEAFSEDNRMDISKAMRMLNSFAFGIKQPWSHGSCFDLMIIEEVCRRLELGVRWNYYNIRDTRTLFDLGVDPKMPKADKHHALHDAFRQVIGVQNVMRELANCGVPVNQTTY